MLGRERANVSFFSVSYRIETGPAFAASTAETHVCGITVHIRDLDYFCDSISGL